MEISVLQSLIDRTSREIYAYEEVMRFDLYNYNWPKEDRMKSVQSFKRKIAKLVKIQKALKKEIAGKLEVQRFMLDYKKQAGERRAVSVLRTGEYANNP
jgi:hypothetical protein